MNSIPLFTDLPTMIEALTICVNHRAKVFADPALAEATVRIVNRRTLEPPSFTLHFIQQLDDDMNMIRHHAAGVDRRVQRLADFELWQRSLLAPPRPKRARPRIEDRVRPRQSGARRPRE